MIATRLALAATLLLPACAGRDPNPVPVVQLKDATMDCAAINAEIAADATRQTDLGKEKGNKVGQNVVAGVVGVALFWPALFLIDFKGAADTESKALESRDQYLGALALQRCQQQMAGPSTTPPVAAQQDRESLASGL
jgi:hypothetical protein